MIRTIKRWLEPPVFQDDEAKTRRAELLNLVILISLAITFLAVLAWLFGKNLSPGTLIIGILWLLVLWASRRLLRSGKSGVVEFILIVIFFVAITGAIISQGSIRSTAISFYVFWVILVVMLYSLPGLLIATCVSSLAVLGLILAENARLLPRADFSVGVRQWLMLTSLFAMTAGLAYFTNKVTRRALASAENEIEQRKQLEDTLRESQESYRILFENATEIILVAQEGKVVFQNPKAATLSGYYGVELMQRSFIEFVHPDDRDMVINRHVKRMKGEDVPPVYSFRLVQKDGGVRWVDASAVMINWKGKPATLNFLADITDRKLYEDELYYSREQYRSLVENINDVIFTLDLQGAFTYMSPAIERLSGFTVSEVEGLSFNRFTHPDDLSGMVEAFTKVISGIKVTYEFRVLDKTGEVRWVVTKSRLVAESDKPPYIAGVMTDITLRKQSEAAKAAFEAKNLQLQKSESLSLMAAAIAHHFNNQLGVVIGNLEMAIGEQAKGVSASRSLTEAMKGAWKAADMSGMMLTYLGQSRDKREPLDLSSSCHKILSAIKSAMPENVTMETDFSSPGPVISTNPDYIHQILTNLFINAWEAVGKESGTVSLSVKTVASAEIPAAQRFPIDWQPQASNYACLSVTDTGNGIEDKDIEKLFDPFYTSKFTGRGMGLAVVLGIVKTHKGVLTVESKVKQGSTFRIFFPLAE